ncbi:MAG TPA: hypothetical protein PLM77_15590, partial [Phycisphaerae bacterium]|nr:hypothetical protein [Phycisphaerae bacterium]
MLFVDGLDLAGLNLHFRRGGLVSRLGLGGRSPLVVLAHAAGPVRATGRTACGTSGQAITDANLLFGLAGFALRLFAVALG